MDRLVNSWNSFNTNSASGYLKDDNQASVNSKKILVNILKKSCESGSISIIDLGCGNGQLYDYFKKEKLSCNYTGVDFSVPLIEAARSAHKTDRDANFIVGDISKLEGINGKYDFAIFSHVIEMASSPDSALFLAKKIAKRIVIRFFEPPEFEFDLVELREMEVGDGKKVPYIRRKMSKEFYRLILTKIKCARVEIYRDGFSNDQIHVLYY